MLMPFVSPAITQIDNKGGIVNIFSAEEGKVLEIECSDLFVLYNDSRVVQYSKTSDYIHTYLLEGKKSLPSNNQIRVSGGSLFFALCDSSPKDIICPNPTIYQWNVVGGPLNRTISRRTTSNVSKVPTIANIELPTDKTVTFRNIKVNPIKQNANFNAVSYKKKDSTVVVYFSGNMQRSTIGDTLITEYIFPDGKESISVNYIQIRNTPIIRPISNYASNIFQSDGLNFLVLHGGLSSDFKTIYSKIHSIDLSNGYFDTKE